MIDHSPNLSFLGAYPAAVPRAALRAYLALVAAVGATLTALMLMLSVAADSGSEAERITETRSDGYAATLASALATNLSKPLR